MTDRDPDDGEDVAGGGTEDAARTVADRVVGDVEDVEDGDEGRAGIRETDRDEEMPLAELTRNVEERRRNRETPDVDEVFEPAGSEQVVDGEAVWESLVDEQDDSGLVAFAMAVESESEDVHVIPSSVCHGCPHFGDPPELHCAHEGTTIRRVVDMDRFEVVACPVVERRSDLHGN